jgi:hypothetical protein
MENALGLFTICIRILRQKYKQTREAHPFSIVLMGCVKVKIFHLFLFSIYLNDLENFLQGKNVKGTDTHLAIEDAHMYLKLLILLYADDTVIFSENEHDMQNALKYFKEYCNKWRLTVNVDKTKIVIFRKGRRRRHTIFNLGNENIEILDEYKYLGIYFTRTGSFIKTKKYLAEQANKALFSLLRKINQLSLPFDIQIDLFEKTIKPI